MEGRVVLVEKWRSTLNALLSCTWLSPTEKHFSMLHLSQAVGKTVSSKPQLLNAPIVIPQVGIAFWRQKPSQQECLNDASGWRGMNGFVSDDREAKVTQTSTRYNHGALKSISEHRTLTLTQQRTIMAAGMDAAFYFEVPKLGNRRTCPGLTSFLSWFDLKVRMWFLPALYQHFRLLEFGFVSLAIVAIESTVHLSLCDHVFPQYGVQLKSTSVLLKQLDLFLQSWRCFHPHPTGSLSSELNVYWAEQWVHWCLYSRQISLHWNAMECKIGITDMQQLVMMSLQCGPTSPIKKVCRVERNHRISPKKQIY